MRVVGLKKLVLVLFGNIKINEGATKGASKGTTEGAWKITTEASK